MIWRANKCMVPVEDICFIFKVKKSVVYKVGGRKIEEEDNDELTPGTRKVAKAKWGPPRKIEDPKKLVTLISFF